MSLLKKIAHGVAGFATGGIGGAIAGFAAPSNPRKTKNVGIDPRVNQTKGKVQLNPNLSPVPISGVSATGDLAGMPSAVNSMSASGLVRNAAAPYESNGFGGGPYQGRAAAFSGGMPILNPSGAAPSFGGGGGSMSWGAGMNPGWLYRHFYTKKGTPRRIRRDGQPYAAPRMNPMNPRAARRAIRRIRGARKLLQRIERSLPKAHTHRRTSSRGRNVEVIRTS